MRVLLSIYYWIAGFLIFFIFLISALIVSYLFPPEKYNAWLKAILRSIFKAINSPVVVEGAEFIEPDKSYLYMANHVSLFDIPLLGGFLPGFVRGVEAQKQHSWPLYGWVMGRLGNIPIERKNIHKSITSIHRAVAKLKTGVSIIILPEGYRSMDGELLPFKKLPFYMAKQMDAEIIPVGLSGLFRLKSKNTWIIQPTSLRMRLGKPIPVDRIASLSESDLRDVVREEVRILLEG